MRARGNRSLEFVRSAASELLPAVEPTLSINDVGHATSSSLPQRCQKGQVASPVRARASADRLHCVNG